MKSTSRVEDKREGEARCDESSVTSVPPPAKQTFLFSKFYLSFSLEILDTKISIMEGSKAIGEASRTTSFSFTPHKSFSPIMYFNLSIIMKMNKINDKRMIN